MIRKTLVVALGLLAAGSVSAQTYETSGNEEYSVDKYKVETNRFWSNWFVSVGGGANMYFGDHDPQMKFGDRLAPALDVAIGKWFTPGIGVRVMYSGLCISGATQNGSHSNGKPISGKPWQGYWLEEQDFDFFNIHADVMFNMSNLLCGYNEKRIWNCSPYIGVGWAHVWDKPSTREVSMNVGILNSFRITSSLDINLDIRGMLVNDRFDGEVGQAKEDGLLTATVGLTYKFPLRGWNHVKNVEPVDMAALNALRQKVDQLSRDNERLQRALEAGRKEEAKTIVKKINVASPNLVTFQIGKSKLSNEAKANLSMLAEVIKTGDANMVYTVTGYADAGTGSKSLNERLSKKRAEAVKDFLVKECGVKESQLEVDYKGGVGNMFYDDPRLSRAVITKSK